MLCMTLEHVDPATGERRKLGQLDVVNTGCGTAVVGEYDVTWTGTSGRATARVDKFPRLGYAQDFGALELVRRALNTLVDEGRWS